jgi:hypothetical protein
LCAEGLQRAVVQTGEALDASASADQLWMDRRVRVIDGTGIALPDTPANQDGYPQPAAPARIAGHPAAGIKPCSAPCKLVSQESRQRQENLL